MRQINSELREGPDGEPEVWTNLRDILDWLTTLPQHSNHPAAGPVALEIRDMLVDSVVNADVIQRRDS